MKNLLPLKVSRQWCRKNGIFWELFFSSNYCQQNVLTWLFLGTAPRLPRPYSTDPSISSLFTEPGSLKNKICAPHWAGFFPVWKTTNTVLMRLAVSYEKKSVPLSSATCQKCFIFWWWKHLCVQNLLRTPTAPSTFAFTHLKPYFLLFLSLYSFFSRYSLES